MHIETRKLHLIEEMLKVKSEATLSALENLLMSTSSKTKKNTLALKDFSGIWSKDEAEEMDKHFKEIDNLNLQSW